MPSHCGCTPGTEENGWHEGRCDDCLAEERRVWAQMMDRMRLLRHDEYLVRARQRLAEK